MIHLNGIFGNIFNWYHDIFILSVAAQDEEPKSYYLVDGKNVIVPDVDKNSPVSRQLTTQGNRKSFYIEVELLNDEKADVVGIGIKIETKTVIYRWDDGVILSPNTHIHCKEQCKSGDVIGCRMTLDVNKKGNQPLHNVVFYKNGLAVSNAIILEGSIPISVELLCDSQSKETLVEKSVKLNFGDHPFIHNIGKYKYYCIII